MRFHRRPAARALALASGVAAALTAGCAAKPPVAASRPASAPTPDALLRDARAAFEAGRHADALALYARLADVSVAVPTRREALTAQGLMMLDPGSPHHNLEAARSLLGAAFALYDVVPLELRSAHAAADALAQARAEAARAADANVALTDQQATRERALKTARDEAKALRDETVSLQRTIRALRADLEQRDAALRKAADAVLGTPRPKATTTASQPKERR